MNPGGPTVTWVNDLRVASEKLQRPAVMASDLKDMYERIGFVDVQQLVLRMPINGWARDSRLKEIGWMWSTNLINGLAGFSYQLLNRVFDRTPAEIEVSRRPSFAIVLS